MHPNQRMSASDTSLSVDDQFHAGPQSPYLYDVDGERSASAAWQSRQKQGSSALRRYPTRRINLVKGTVLSVDYPVPSAIRNAIEPKYRDEPGANAEEFTHLRCE